MLKNERHDRALSCATKTDIRGVATLGVIDLSEPEEKVMRVDLVDTDDTIVLHADIAMAVRSS